MKTQKQKDEQAVLFSIRHGVELVLIISIIAGGFTLILHATSPSFLNSHLANNTWWKSTSHIWTKIHSLLFNQGMPEDFDLEQENLYNFESLSSVRTEHSHANILNNNNGDATQNVNIFKSVEGDGDTEYMEDMKLDSRSNSTNQCDILPEGQRFDCHPEKGATSAVCLNRGCCWSHTEDSGQNTSASLTMNVPYCYYPKNYDGYSVNGKPIVTTTGLIVQLKRNTSAYYPQTIMQLVVDVSYETPYRLRVKIYDPNEARWEVPMSRPKMRESLKTDDNMYTVQVPDQNQPFSLTVNRKSTNRPLLNTTGAFMFNDQFLQLSYFLPSTYIYGLGEHRDTLLHSVNWTKYVFWNEGQVPKENTNLYGSHPFYLMIENDTNSHGVLLLNSNAMETILQPAPAITWRTIGGVFDFYIFLGPKPADVISQYTEVIGRTFMPPYWSLGFHQSRWGYKTARKTQEIADKLTKAGMPHDVQWNDLDYMDGLRDFTTSSKFGDQKGLADTLHSQGKHYIMIVDPGISNSNKDSYPPYELGKSLNIFINNSDNKPLVGVVWPGTTVFPDFTNPDTQYYWTTVVKSFHDNVPFDGMWIDMNEISNFIPGSVTGCSLSDRYEHPPYVPDVHGGSLRFATICASAQQHLSRTYDLHNLYGLQETYASYQALLTARPGKRPFIISRSTFSGQGQHGGHWSGDNAATYYDMYKSVSEILNFNMFGIPMVGADICGFRDETTEELCQRWFQLGAFYPFSRSHNEILMPDQDPTAFSEALLNSTRNVYLTRYSLLPYLYTLFHKSHVTGETVARPVFVEFPYDKNTYNIDTQFLWGPALMISPALEKNMTWIEAYFPLHVTWFYFSTGGRMTDVGGTFGLPAPLDFINLNVRGGYIIPMQEPALTTTQSRKNSFQLLVALNRSLVATGDLYWDDGDSVDSYEKGNYNMLQFTAQNKTVTSNLVHLGYTAEPMILSNITVLGVVVKPSSVTLDGQSTPFVYDARREVLCVREQNIDMIKLWTLAWT